MAKLSVVVPSNEVEVGGVKYRKVERKAQAGDIVKALASRTDITDGGFYEVVSASGYVGFYDNVDEFRTPTLAPPRFEVYGKDTELASIEYREVKRVAEVGERIRIVAAAHAYGTYENGEEFTVTSLHGHGGGVRINRKWRTQENTDAWVLHEEYVVLEPVNIAEPEPQPERLKVGEYVKVTDASGSYHAKKGDIAEVITNWSENIIDVKTLDGRTYGMFAHRFVRVTEAEVETAKKAAERAKNIGEFADGGYAVVKSDAAGYFSGGYRGAYVKVRPTLVEGPYALEISLSEQRGYGAYCNADALRKVTREEYEEATKPKPVFNVGDYAKVTADNYEHRVGHIVQIARITDGPFDSFDYAVKRLTYGGNGYIHAKNIEKISAEEATETVKWAAIGRKVGEFKRGDIVKCTGTAAQQAGLGEVVDILRSNRRVRVNYFGRFGTCSETFDIIALVTPVEQRFDRAEGGASSSK